MADAFAAFGIVPEGDLEVEEEFYLWGENVPAFNLWLSVQTQWHTDNGVRTGLNYPGVEVCMKQGCVRKKDRQWYFAALQVMERAALEEWTKER